MNRIVSNFLATSPFAYAYYLMILGGIVWNTLGSTWIKEAFRVYGKPFGACYLVCVILSWVSTFISPTFVFCGMCFVIGE